MPLEEMHRHYQDAAIFCLPSRREPFGVAYVEAMHHGLPVIGTRIGAVPELVEDGVVGYVVEPGDVDALAAAIRRATTDDALRGSLIERGRVRAESFSWDDTADAMVRLYRSLC